MNTTTGLAALLDAIAEATEQGRRHVAHHHPDVEDPDDRDEHEPGAELDYVISISVRDLLEMLTPDMAASVSADELTRPDWRGPAHPPRHLDDDATRDDFIAAAGLALARHAAYRSAAVRAAVDSLAAARRAALIDMRETSP